MRSANLKGITTGITAPINKLSLDGCVEYVAADEILDTPTKMGVRRIPHSWKEEGKQVYCSSNMI